MGFNEILENVRKKAKDFDVSGIDFLAAQIDLTGNDGGTFYVEIKDGKINVEPYEYNDRNCLITISPENFTKLLNRKLDPVAAFTLKKLHVDGDVGKALEIANLLKK